MDFKDFAELEVDGWSDANLADTYVSRFSKATDIEFAFFEHCYP